MDELDKLECEECEECEECQSCDCSCSNGMDSPNHNRIVQWRGTDPNSDKGFYTSTGHYTLDGVTNIPTSQDLCGTAKYNYSWSQITFHENLGKEFCAVLNNTDCSTLKTKSDLWIHAGSSWFKTQVTECMQGQYFKFKPLQN